MNAVIRRRMTARMEGSFVVFLIGARIHRWWKVHHWWPVASAMRRMMRELEQHPEYGYLGGESWFGRTTLMVQYWRSPEQLLAYAKMPNAEHFPAWVHFNRHIAKSADVGIWHETYVVPAGSYECIYHNMPLFGLGRVGESWVAEGGLEDASSRLGAGSKASPHRR